MTTNLTRVADQLGPQLYAACLQNNVGQVESLTATGMNADKWSAVMLAAASKHATDVATYCVQHGGNRLDVADKLLWRVLGGESLYPAYYFLVDANMVDVNHEIDRTGTLLGVAAGLRQFKGYELIEFLLKKGADPSDRAEMHGGLAALTAAAGNADKRMVEILLDNGARLEGSAALAFAARKGNIENVRYLLARGADVNEIAKATPRIRSTDVGSALHKAVEHGQLSVVEALLDAGADLTLKDGKGRTARTIAEEKGMDANVLAMLSPS